MSNTSSFCFPEQMAYYSVWSYIAVGVITLSCGFSVSRVRTRLPAAYLFRF